MKKNKFIISSKTKIIQVLKKFNSNGYKSVLVANENNVLIGSLSEGDIRRSLLKNSTLKSVVEKIYNKKPFYLRKIPKVKTLNHLFQKYDYELIPILNKKNEIKNILTRNYKSKKTQPDFSNKKILPVIMAGGKGLRMKPFTTILPKPLLPIKGKAIIDHIISKLIENKFKKIYVSVSKESYILETYLKKYKKNNLYFIKESKPLGTIGSIKKLKNKNFDNLLVTNCDISLNLDLRDLYKFHMNYNNDLTIVVSKYTVKVPYGVCDFNKNGEFKNIFEKPNQSWFVMCGMYILKKNVLKFIPNNQPMNIDDLIRKLKNTNHNLSVYPIKQSFFNDVGEWEKYLKTTKKKFI
jgi:dTDP-glucose pyrophosphorylase